MRSLTHRNKQHKRKFAQKSKYVIRKHKPKIRIFKHKRTNQNINDHTLTTIGNHSVSSNFCDFEIKKSEIDSFDKFLKELDESKAGYGLRARQRTIYIQDTDQKDELIPIKIYHERNLLFESSATTQGIELKDHVTDFDCPTKINQIDSLAQSVDEEILGALDEFQKDRSIVINGKKFITKKPFLCTSKD